jgi:segregation and condensation protein B
MSNQINQLSAQIEAVLSTKAEAVTITDIAELTDSDAKSVQQAISHLKDKLEERGLELIQHEDGIQLVSAPEHSDLIAQQRQQEVDTNLTKAQSEALAVIAYMAPVTKSAIDFVRGVNSRSVLRNLSTRGLINKQQKQDTVQFSLSSEALQHLGITSIQDLPKYEQTKKRLSEFVETNQGND